MRIGIRQATRKDKDEYHVGWKREVTTRTARRLRRQKVKNDEDADAVEVNFLSTSDEDRK